MEQSGLESSVSSTDDDLNSPINAIATEPIRSATEVDIVNDGVQRNHFPRKQMKKGLAQVFGQILLNKQEIEVKFEGAWLNGSRSGAGRLTTSLSSEYDGEWLKGRRHGHGMQVYPTGNIYRGQWRHDMKSGFGIMKWIDQQQVYEGEWCFDKPDGIGTHVWFGRSCPGFDMQSIESLADCPYQVSLCNRYKGDFKNGQRHGQGEFLYSNGAVYTGSWAHNLKHGPGIFIHINGCVREGIWSNDILEGEGRPQQSTCIDQPKLILDYQVKCDDLFPVAHSKSALSESEMISTVLLRNNDHLRRMVVFYESCGDAMVPRMKLASLWMFIRDCNLRSGCLTRSQIDCVVACHNTDSLSPHDGRRVILFRELHEVLVRISVIVLSKQATDHVSDAVKILIQNIIVPRFEICVKAVESSQRRSSLDVLELVAPVEGLLRSLFKQLENPQTSTVPSRILFQCLLKNGATSGNILRSFNDTYRCDLTCNDDLVLQPLDFAGDEVLFEEFIEIIGRCFKSLPTPSDNDAHLIYWIQTLLDFHI